MVLFITFYQKSLSYYTDNEVIKELGKELEESKNKYLELQYNHIGLINENFILKRLRCQTSPVDVLKG